MPSTSAGLSSRSAGVAAGMDVRSAGEPDDTGLLVPVDVSAAATATLGAAARLLAKSVGVDPPPQADRSAVAQTSEDNICGVCSSDFDMVSLMKFGKERIPFDQP